MRRMFFLGVLLSFLLSAPAHAADAPLSPPKDLLRAGFGVDKRLVPSSSQVTVTNWLAEAAPSLNVAVRPGPDAYPGVALKPEGPSWDLSAYGHVEAKLVNTGTEPLSLALRVDNAGDWKDNPWNTESVTLAPGEAGTVTTIFGYAYGHKPGYALKPSAVTQVLLFTGKTDITGKTDKPLSFRLVSLTASGPPNEKPSAAPEDVRVKPVNGLLLGAETRITSEGASTSFRPAIGRWDLRDFLEVCVRLKNEGQAAVTPRMRLESNGGPSDWKSSAPLPPGADADVVVPFAGDAPANLTEKKGGSHVTSDAVSAVVLDAGSEVGAKSLRVVTIRAVLPPSTLPAWLGQRPPVAGDWVKTLDDEFSGSTLDPKLWNVYGDNYWDKQTHWSRNDVLVGGGVVKLRYEKKTGFNNDDPKQKPSDYAAGYLHTYDRWTQRYGYFEARMKLPTTPGLWPAFWMMPDRGPAAGPEQWKRQDTGNGGMEFDVMEHLTRWGHYRYNIAMHYDGYGRDHKVVGSDKIYVQPDKDGFLTCGLLWTPGSAIYYCNGREVLRWEDPRVSSVPAILMFTVPAGGWDNSALDETKLPSDFTIDYVRVWQRKDLAAPADGKIAPP